MLQLQLQQEVGYKQAETISQSQICGWRLVAVAEKGCTAHVSEFYFFPYITLRQVERPTELSLSSQLFLRIQISLTANLFDGP